MIGHRIDFNGVGALRGQRHIPATINPSTPRVARKGLFAEQKKKKYLFN